METKMIAIFMGGKMLVEDYHGVNIVEFPDFSTKDLFNLKYATSWDLLMPVVVKITESEEFHNEYPDKGSFWENYSSVDKTRIYEAVIKYIKWYNENQFD